MYQVVLEHTAIKWVFEMDPREISKRLTAYSFILGPTAGVVGAILGARTGGKIRTATLGSSFFMSTLLHSRALLPTHPNAPCFDRHAGVIRNLDHFYERSRWSICEGNLVSLIFVFANRYFVRSLGLSISWKSPRFRTS